MAYTFTDHYRTVRMILRIDAVVVGLGLGLLLLVYPVGLLARLGVDASGPAWTAHVAGGSLLGLGTGLLLAAGEPELRRASLLAAIVGNSLIAFALLLAYFQGGLAELTFLGSLLLIGVFVVCLLSVVFPIPYLGRERRRY